MTDDNIVQFPQPNDQVWVCNCGCQSWRLLSDGEIECCNCHNNSCGGGSEWRKKLPDADPANQRDVSGTIVITAMGSVAFAQNAVFKTIENWYKAGRLSLMVAYDIDGRSKYWTGIETEEDKEFCLRKLRELIDVIEQTKV